jgi:hypothetical protein
MMRAGLMCRVVATVVLAATPVASAMILVDYRCKIGSCGSGTVRCWTFWVPSPCTRCNGGEMVEMCVANYMGEACETTGRNILCGNTIVDGTCQFYSCSGGRNTTQDCRVVECVITTPG